MVSVWFGCCEDHLMVSLTKRRTIEPDRLALAPVLLLWLTSGVQRRHGFSCKNRNHPLQPILLRVSLMHCCIHVLQGTIQELVRAGDKLLRPDGFHHPFAGCKIRG
jgi:hypothetical protein